MISNSGRPGRQLAFVFLPLLALTAAACQSGSDPYGEESPSSGRVAESEQTAPGRFGSHGMVISGDEGSAFLSHIPLFAFPHDVQVITAGRFSVISGPALPATFSSGLFTFLPERMSLDALRLGTSRELRGQIFAGNFESDGRPLGSKVKFEVTRVIHQHLMLEPAPPQPDLTYVLYGTKEKTFAIHKLAAAPSFDEVLRVEIGADGPSNDELAAGVEVKISGTPDAQASRLGASSAGKTAQAGSRSFSLKSALTLSCLEGPEFSNPCR